MEYLKFKPDIRELTLKHGISYPSDEELLMMILGSGTKKIPIATLAKKVISKIMQSNYDDLIPNLLSIEGMGISKSLSVAAALEFGRRKNQYRNARILMPNDIVPFVKSYSMQKQEHFLCVSLNGSHEIIQIRVITVGTVNRTIVHPREIFSEALKDNAAAVIVAHNHPSGAIEPSEEDIETTQMLLQAANILGISLLDHIIFNSNTYFSFVEHGIMELC